ncbi:MAG: tetratricopeptide repeat protein [Legionella sp.]|nr:tetratricopeptide repeat protein [Legionella sp.]
MRVIFRLVMLLPIVLSVTACISPLNLAEGISSFQAQDYRRAFIRLKPEAEKGHPDAQYAIGYMYYYGQGVVEDKEQAWKWINRAAHKGQPQAIAALKIIRFPPHVVDRQGLLDNKMKPILMNTDRESSILRR